MANEFTKKYHRARTTTSIDYSAYQWLDTKVKQDVRRELRVLSPSRRDNPHPAGMVTQKPYNRDYQSFATWNPNLGEIGQRLPSMLSHINRTNFSCGLTLPPVIKRGPPEIKYTLNSTYRRNYQQPPEMPNKYRPLIKKSRFGHTPYNLAHGIVPITLPPIYSPLQK